MARASLVPITLPADPTAALEAATKQYVDRLTGQSWTFDTATATNAAPAGTVRYNNAAAGSTSFIGIAKTNANGTDVSALLSRIARGTVLLIRSAAGVAHAFAVQGDPSSFATCFEWNVTPLVSTGTMTNGVSLTIDSGYDARYNFLEDLADTAHSASSGQTNGQVLQWNSGTGLWEAQDDGIFVGTSDPGVANGFDLWYDTDATASVGLGTLGTPQRFTGAGVSALTASDQTAISGTINLATAGAIYVWGVANIGWTVAGAATTVTTLVKVNGTTVGGPGFTAPVPAPSANHLVSVPIAGGLLTGLPAGNHTVTLTARLSTTGATIACRSDSSLFAQACY